MPTELYKERNYLLKERDGGLIYSIYIAMLSESVKYNGKLMMSQSQPHTKESLVKLIGIGNIRTMNRVIDILQAHKLIEYSEKHKYYFMTEIPELTMSRQTLASYRANNRYKEIDEK